ncbi:hypothetical protein BC830DRAFT_1069725, partial [Chytriomyces sp. MP71]
LLLKAELENLTNLRVPVDYDFEFKVKCASCHAEHAAWVSINATVSEEIPNSRGEANFVMRCKECKAQTNASFVVSFPPSPTLQPYTGATPQPQRVLTIETRGLDFVGWRPTYGQAWTAEGEESGMVFDDIEFEEGELDWAGYDEKAGCSVGVNGIEGSFAKSK